MICGFFVCKVTLQRVQLDLLLQVNLFLLGDVQCSLLVLALLLELICRFLLFLDFGIQFFDFVIFADQKSVDMVLCLPCKYADMSLFDITRRRVSFLRILCDLLEFVLGFF